MSDAADAAGIGGGDAPASAGAPPAKKRKLGKKERQRLRAMAEGTYVAPTQPTKAPPKPKQARQPYNGGMAPSLLTRHIREAWTPDALLATCDKYRDRVNHIHASAAWNSLGRLAADDREWWRREPDALESLTARTLELVRESPDMGPRELANVAHGVAKSGARSATLPSLLDAVAESLAPRLPECNPQELANAAWAFAKSDHAGDAVSALVRALASEITAKADRLNPQELTNAAWAFATVGADASSSESVATLFDALARSSARNLAGFSPQGLSNTAWAFAKVGATNDALMDAMTTRATAEAASLNPRDLANVAWAFARSGRADERCFAALADAAERRVDDFSTQGLANTAWAHAKAGVSAPTLFSALARALESRFFRGRVGEDVAPQDVSNAAWAFARACQFAAAIRRQACCAEDASRNPSSSE